MLRTRAPLYSDCSFRARLACVRHAASVRSEPGSNSPRFNLECIDWRLASKSLLIQSLASVLSVCVPTELIFVALRILAVLLGLAIRFSKSDLRFATCFFYIFNRLPCNLFFTALLRLFCFVPAPFFRGGAGGVYIHHPEFVKVLFSSVSGEPAEERPCIPSRFPGLGASLSLSFPRVRQGC